MPDCHGRSSLVVIAGKQNVAAGTVELYCVHDFSGRSPHSNAQRGAQADQPPEAAPRARAAGTRDRDQAG